jgi:hypothetical protein
LEKVGEGREAGEEVMLTNDQIKVFNGANALLSKYPSLPSPVVEFISCLLSQTIYQKEQVVKPLIARRDPLRVTKETRHSPEEVARHFVAHVEAATQEKAPVWLKEQAMYLIQDVRTDVDMEGLLEKLEKKKKEEDE